jgi:hypothetical protein
VDDFVGRRQSEWESHGDEGLAEFDAERSEDVGALKECVKLMLG